MRRIKNSNMGCILVQLTKEGQHFLTPVLDKEEKKQFLTDHSNISESSPPLHKNHF